MRDDLWLKNKFDEIWNKHFSNVSRLNEIEIKFGRYARTRLGSIKQVNVKHFIVNKANHQPSVITITGYFKAEIVPEYVVCLVIAHELCHYAHGFCSPHPQLYKNPHQGKVIDKELYKRGFGKEIREQKAWLKDEWPKIIGTKLHIKRRSSRRKQMTPLGILKFLVS